MIDNICVNDVLMTNVDIPSTKKYLYSLRNTDYNELSIVSKL